jgi:quercetin dioxygenase-like cupin family protein
MAGLAAWPGLGLTLRDRGVSAEEMRHARRIGQTHAAAVDGGRAFAAFRVPRRAEHAWEETKFPGIRMKMLFNDAASGMCTMLMRLEPGAEVPLHEHTAIEQTWVIEGRFLDEEGECGPGQFVWRPPGNTHVAWAGPEGATILGVFLKPNVFADGRKFFSQERGGQG